MDGVSCYIIIMEGNIYYLGHAMLEKRRNLVYSLNAVSYNDVKE
jgi:hypothetical protein